jgi:hypothetical protein
MLNSSEHFFITAGTKYMTGLQNFVCQVAAVGTRYAEKIKSLFMG